jgi:hypothetical protein
LSSKVALSKSFVGCVENPAWGARKHDLEKGNGNDSCGPSYRLGSDGQSDPGFDLAALNQSATAHTAQLSAGIVFRFEPSMPSL